MNLLKYLPSLVRKACCKVTLRDQLFLKSYDKLTKEMEVSRFIQ